MWTSNTVHLAAPLCSATLAFDAAFGEAVSNRQIYSAVCESVVRQVLRGGSGALVACGHAEAGKTHTLGLGTSSGVFHYALLQVCQWVAALSDTQRWRMRMWGFHVTDTEVFDLAVGGELVEARADAAPGLESGFGARRHHYVHSREDVVAFASCCAAEAARSGRLAHLLLYLTLQVQDTTVQPATITSCSLCFADLAGLDRAPQGLRRGQVDRSGVAKSLASFERLVSATTRARDAQLPTDSLLTKLLADHINPSTLTTLLVCVHATPARFADVVATLPFSQTCLSQELTRQGRRPESAGSASSQRAAGDDEPAPASAPREPSQ
jgi:hypothetical protein